LTPSIAKQLPKVVRMAVGTTVFRIRIELIFRRCWNLITPSRSCRERRGLRAPHFEVPLSFRTTEVFKGVTKGLTGKPPALPDDDVFYEQAD
jgi:hypothetical protein